MYLDSITSKFNLLPCDARIWALKTTFSLCQEEGLEEISELKERGTLRLPICVTWLFLFAVPVIIIPVSLFNHSIQYLLQEVNRNKSAFLNLCRTGLIVCAQDKAAPVHQCFIPRDLVLSTAISHTGTNSSVFFLRGQLHRAYPSTFSLCNPQS